MRCTVLLRSIVVLALIIKVGRLSAPKLALMLANYVSCPALCTSLIVVTALSNHDQLSDAQRTLTFVACWKARTRDPAFSLLERFSAWCRSLIFSYFLPSFEMLSILRKARLKDKEMRILML